MKMKIILKFLITVCLITTLVLSCNENQEVSPDQPVSVINGVLAFDSQKDFEQTLRHLLEHQEGLKQWELQFDSYVSLNTAFKELLLDIASYDDQENQIQSLLSSNSHLYEVSTRSGEAEMIPLTDDEILATVFNKDGLVIIGGELMKISSNTVYKKEFNGKQELREAVLGDQYFINAKAEQLPFTKEIVDYDPATGRKIETCRVKYNSGKKRLRGEIFKNKIGKLFSSIGARTKHQKKRLGLWTADDTRRIRLKVDGELTQQLITTPPKPPKPGSPPIPPVGGVITKPINFDKTNSGDNKISKTFEFCLSGGEFSCEFDIEYMDNYHWCECDDRQQRSCTTEK